MAGEPKADGITSTPFTDVSPSASYADAVAWCYFAGVVNGTSETTFTPEASITREQIVTMFHRYAEKVAKADMSVKNDLTKFTDAGSTKKFIWEHIRSILPEGVWYVAGHPMTGRELSGVTAAKADLFKGKAYVIVEDTGAPPEVVEKLMSVLRLTEAKFVTLDIAKHDRCASVISHVPHVTAAALVTLLNRSGGDLESCIKLIGGGFKDTTRIASSNADMWADICMTNGDAIATNLRQLQTILGEVIDAVERKDRQAVHDYFAASKQRRDSLLEAVKFDPN